MFKICIRCNEYSKHYALDFCRKCYDKNLRGNPVKNKKRLWLKEHKNYVGNDCLIFPFGRNGNGYGQFIDKNGKLVLAHRAMCCVKNGKPPTRYHLATHTCGKGHTGCVNPNHLVWKTHKQNTQDRYAHGTMGKTLNEKIVSKIKKHLKRNTESFREIGKRFGVSGVTVFNIKHKKTWSHVR